MRTNRKTYIRRNDGNVYHTAAQAADENELEYDALLAHLNKTAYIDGFAGFTFERLRTPDEWKIDAPGSTRS